MNGELRLALPEEYTTAPLVTPSAPDAKPAPEVPDLTLAPYDGSADSTPDHARHLFQYDVHGIDIQPAHNTVEPPPGPEPEPPPPPVSGCIAMWPRSRRLT